jgi:ABC-2 type transport system permease protein
MKIFTHKFYMNFSWPRLWAVMLKEFIQMRRDRTTFAIIVAIPIIQIILFGYAVNSNPKYLPMAVVAADNSHLTRALIKGLENTEYFRVTHMLVSEQQAETLLQKGQVQFVLNIPPDFTQEFVRGKRPQILLEADATDPAATGFAFSAAHTLMNSVFNTELTGQLQSLRSTLPPAELITHLRYNPEIETAYNIVPGLIGVVLIMTMVMITSQAITRERERGTMESLLATPVQPIEVIVGKITPYIIVGYIQMSIIILMAVVLFNVPIEGSLTLLSITTLPFLAANLTLGLMISTFAKNQLQATQMTIFYFLPSILLSGFMFPFRGMPDWAQWIGSMLPLTHYLRIVRGILLKGNHLIDVLSYLWPILLFFVVTLILGAKFYRRTLD